jgi:hypothetical protein
LTAADWQRDQALSEDLDVVRWTLHPAGLDEAAARVRSNAAARAVCRQMAIVADAGYHVMSTSRGLSV